MSQPNLLNLKLNLKGSVDPLVGYLKNFSEIDNSILLEVDPTGERLLAKTFTKDSGSVRFSAISFADCNLSVVSNSGAEALGNSRILVALLNALKKSISILKRFSEINGGNVDMTIDIDYALVKLKKTGAEHFAGLYIVFSDQKLEMKLDGFRLSEFKYLTDEKFFSVFNVQTEYSFELSPETIESIIKTYSIVKLGDSDALTFFVEGNGVYVRDSNYKFNSGAIYTEEYEISLDTQKSVKSSNFTLKIGELPTTPTIDLSANILGSRFVGMVASGEPFRVIFGKPENAPTVDRLLFDSTQTNTKLVISTIFRG